MQGMRTVIQVAGLVDFKLVETCFGEASGKAGRIDQKEYSANLNHVTWSTDL